MILRAMFALSLLLMFWTDTATISVMQQLQGLHPQKLTFQCACNAMPLLAFRPCTLCKLRVVCGRIDLGQTKLSQVVCDMDKMMRVLMLLRACHYPAELQLAGKDASAQAQWSRWQWLSYCNCTTEVSCPMGKQWTVFLQCNAIAIVTVVAIQHSTSARALLGSSYSSDDCTKQVTIQQNCKIIMPATLRSPSAKACVHATHQIVWFHTGAYSCTHMG
jgi:Rad3-related DNA helicase